MNLLPPSSLTVPLWITYKPKWMLLKNPTRNLQRRCVLIFETQQYNPVSGVNIIAFSFPSAFQNAARCLLWEQVGTHCSASACLIITACSCKQQNYHFARGGGEDEGGKLLPCGVQSQGTPMSHYITIYLLCTFCIRIYVRTSKDLALKTLITRTAVNWTKMYFYVFLAGVETRWGCRRPSPRRNPKAA